ncbi:folylpolyglutamate synthase, mitochondrial-like [Gigantopelta aegis]|uniref:folylpolyglutamate synthase, mitochondrial-like n=1 Tax=Gigantopelta aegis TaxID=1735272 RepID=UPI001B888B54|nr:folylpolyglutamate synthase, mitochondrial-like [Gigantopelta aegis]
MRQSLVANVLSKLMCSAKARKPGHRAVCYEDAVSTLNSLQSNAAAIEKARKERDTRCKQNIPCMIEFIRRSGLTLEDVDMLPVIHISGTKGKGSTSAFCESILRHSGYKTGFFSSPHLVKVTERFRINGQPMSDSEFCSYFFDVYNKLESTKNDMQGREMPGYFGFLTVLAFNVFIKENVDVAVIEVGIGGQYDSTNFIRSPVVCGVTSLGIDHVALLGNTIDKIAWNKAGIFKKGVPALTVDQPPEAEEVLLQRSQQIGAPLYHVPTLEQFHGAGQQLQLGIDGSMQYVNAGLALQLCRVFVDRTNKVHQYAFDVSSVPGVKDIPTLPVYRVNPDIVEGLANCSWPGRNQTIRHHGLTYYLDGAHTKESMQQCVEWFCDKSKKEAATIKGRVCKVLIFNATGDRNISCLLSILKTVRFNGVVFCPNLAFSGPTSNTPDQSSVLATKERQLETSKKNKKIWDGLCENCSNEDCVSNGHCSSVLTNGLASSPAPSINGSTDTTVRTIDRLPSDRGMEMSDLRMNNKVRTSDESFSYAFPCILQALNWTTQGRDPNLSGDADIDIYNIPETLQSAAHIQVLVTGSLHLVGGVLGLVSPNLSD